MKASMPYDCIGVDGRENKNAFVRLPSHFQLAIKIVQSSIQSAVDQENPGLFIPTSGFRAQSVNNRYGGALESLHRFGLARDFVPVGGFSANSKPPVFSSGRFRVLRSPENVNLQQKCWHVFTVDEVVK